MVSMHAALAPLDIEEGEEVRGKTGLDLLKEYRLTGSFVYHINKYWLIFPRGFFMHFGGFALVRDS